MKGIAPSLRVQKLSTRLKNLIPVRIQPFAAAALQDAKLPGLLPDGVYLFLKSIGVDIQKAILHHDKPWSYVTNDLKDCLHLFLQGFELCFVNH
jgi:hypothetical protein